LKELEELAKRHKREITEINAAHNTKVDELTSLLASKENERIASHTKYS